ncbi:uncharacterized protein LOC131956878, partial [Physella acuta]|uniref:uncharacterized protein LOC131956878 n=1 Tax=Physella acuta TaxID=109671 RepID=UPI0027DB8395
VSCELNCWHCISENCDQDPRNVFSAEKRTCYQGQKCQVSCRATRGRNVRSVAVLLGIEMSVGTEMSGQLMCYQGQKCQKVVFEMLSEPNTKYTSTVRSCADECIPQDDFLNNNCTDDIYTSRGCVQRVCCDDNDLCNTAENSFSNFLTLVLTSSACWWISSVLR